MRIPGLSERSAPKADLQQGGYASFEVAGRPTDVANAAIGRVAISSEGDPLAKLDESYSGKSFSIMAGFNKWGLSWQGSIAGEFTHVDDNVVSARLDANMSTFPVIPEGGTMDAVYNPETGHSHVTVNVAELSWRGVASVVPGMLRNRVKNHFDSKVRACLASLAVEKGVSHQGQTPHSARKSAA